MEAEVSTVEALRAKFEAAREAAPAAEVRAAAVAYYRARAAQGATQTKVAEELGLTQPKLAKWHQKQGFGGERARSDDTRAPSAASAECASLKRDIEQLGPRSPSRRFPEELKQRVARWARGELARGVGAAGIAAQVGVPWESISRWLGRQKSPSKTAPNVRAVRVVNDAPAVAARVPTGPVLRTPGGITVEGLNLPLLVELLRQLG